MTPETVASVARETIFALLMVSTPIMLVALVVGLIIGLLQALTSIQESTLTFVPKIILVFAALIVLFPFMANQMNTLTQSLFARMVHPEDVDNEKSTATETTPKTPETP